ncbi:MAG: DUF4244 domain-containing protein [Aurantimicrobium sp.]|nr:DUF4244 domain-containing protein [Aurantimicrobium sp.]
MRAGTIDPHIRPGRCTKKGTHMKTISEMWRDERGAATAEYAIATMAAVGFAGLLVMILKGDGVRGLLTNVITGALGIGG